MLSHVFMNLVNKKIGLKGTKLKKVFQNQSQTGLKINFIDI